MIKSILLAIDGSVYSEAVIISGIEFAQKLNAFIRAITIVDVRIYEWVMNTGGEGYMPLIPSNVYKDESFNFLNKRADTIIDKVKKQLQKSNISYEVKKYSGSPIEIICNMARQVDLVIMGSRGDYERWGDNLLGATLESVSRQCQIPMMIVDKKYVSPKVIICAYDRSEYSNRALKLSAYLSEILNLPIEVVTVNNDEEEGKIILNEAKNYLDPYKVNVSFKREIGDVEKVLSQITHESKNQTLLIMGCYGHSRIREAILGSTTVQVMRKAAKPIILTK
jgi:nucleotide-binding universal stress UspA family protein